MHMVINISLDLLIRVWIRIENFIMKKIVWLFIDKKIHLLNVMDFWSWKIWTGCLIGTSQNGKKIKMIHIPNLLLELNIWSIMR